MASKYPRREDIGHDQPLRLAVAAALAFPDGSMTASGLRRESTRGRLVIERIAGKDYTTLGPYRGDEGAMPRRSKGARLWLESEERDARGKLIRHATWVIRDGARKVRTGCAREDRSGAERRLPSTLPASTEPRANGTANRLHILVLDVLNIYLADKAGKHARPEETKQRVLTLADFWQPHACGYQRQALPRLCDMACRPVLAIGQARSDREPAAASYRGGRTPRIGGPSRRHQPSPPGRLVLGDRVSGNSREGGCT